MGRAERRREERRQKHEEVMDRHSAYAQAIVKRDAIRKAKLAEIERNGITNEHLKENYRLGYHDALVWASEYYQPFFYSAIAICAHRDLKFGETRMIRFLESVQQVMIEEISTGDIIERARRETGMDIRNWCDHSEVV